MSSLRSPTIDLLLSDDDEEDELLLASAKPVFAKKPAAASSTEEQLTPLGSASFVIQAISRTVKAGDAVQLTREDSQTAYDQSVIRISTLQGQNIGYLSREEALLLTPILSKMQAKVKLTAEVTQTVPFPIIQVHFSAKANRILSSFEVQPVEDGIRSHLKHKFIKTTPTTMTACKPPPPPASSRVTPSPPTVASSSSTDLTTTAAALPEAVASMMTQQQQPHSSLVPVGSCALICTGTQYYAGTARVGDQVQLVRDRKNVHDRNAVRVETMQGIAVGHIRKEEAAMLSKVLDEPALVNRMRITASMRAHGTSKTKPISVVFMAPSSEVAYFQMALRNYLSYTFTGTATAQDMAVLAKPSSSSSCSTSAAESTSTSSANDDLVTQGLVEMSTAQWEAQKDQLDEMFEQQACDQVANLPKYAMPALLNNLHLFEHQIEGIRWLIHQEQGDLPPYFEQLEENGRKRWRCAITKCLQLIPPKPIRGGILADDMGLGKTLQTLGLILANPPEGQTSYPYKSRGLRDRGIPRCTLIVCPLSVMANWSVQINRHVNGRVKNKNLSVAIYHGPSRDDLLVRVENNDLDVLLASYHTLASDLKKLEESLNPSVKKLPSKKKRKKGPFIFDLDFHRVVLDEAHIIRSSETGLFKAAVKLQAKRKLCLTGTPFVNRPTDIHSLLAFLGVEPLSNQSVFNRLVVNPIKERKEIGLKTIRATMAYVALRRNKHEVDKQIDLVDKEVQLRLITFPARTEHKENYDILFSTARGYFLSVLGQGESEVFLRFMELLALVLRIRQSCCHYCLVPEDYRERAAEMSGKIAKKGVARAMELDEGEGETLLQHLQGTFEGTQLVECSVCMNEMEEDNAVILRACKHIFCEACLNQVQNSSCPMCRAPFTPDDMIKKQTAEAATKKNKSSTKDATLATKNRSPKIQAMLDAIDEMKPDEKGVIFSQWTSVLDIIQAELVREGHTFTRVDGTMNAQARIDAMEAFDSERCDSMKHPRFILCSLHACGTGINLVRGNVVFMMDPWWNVAAENQAMDRVHRIGQTRPVRVMRFLMKNSIEERMVDLQDSKALLGKGSMEQLSPAEKRKARLTALMDLFEVKPQDLEWT